MYARTLFQPSFVSALGFAVVDETRSQTRQNAVEPEVQADYEDDPDVVFDRELYKTQVSKHCVSGHVSAGILVLAGASGIALSRQPSLLSRNGLRTQFTCEHAKSRDSCTTCRELTLTIRASA